MSNKIPNKMYQTGNKRVSKDELSEQRMVCGLCYDDVILSF